MIVLIEEPGARLRARSLAVALATALGNCFAFAPGIAHAHVQTVINCNEAGSGSLREAVVVAASGDTIDLSTLACGTITLTSGAIVVTQSDLRIQGPGADVLTIDGYFNDRVFHHTGSGTLTLFDLTISDGKYVSPTTPRGGCIDSAGSVIIDATTVSNCVLVGQGDSVARGGGIFTNGSLAVLASRITGSVVSGGGTPISNSHGGAAVADGFLSVKYSTVSDNHAITIDGHNSASGAFQAYASAQILGSTISGNSAVFFGALCFEGNDADTIEITNSTISGNTANTVSGIYTQVPTVVSNSTIAFNSATFGRGAFYSQTDPVEFESTIMSGNSKSGGLVADDLDGTGATVVTGANNLIVASAIAVPPDTITSCAKLRPLDDNGGLTLTHAIAGDSPALDHGNNVADLDNDQRGADRVFGIGADIGAVEWNSDEIFGFRSGFEPVCDG